MMAASIDQRLRGVEREAKRSITKQVADVFAAAIASGELEPGAKLPTTRELARVAGINAVTAGRCYRRLQEQGLVVSTVGRGTFVRGAAVAASDELSWQTYALAQPRGGYAGAVLMESTRHGEDPGLIPLSLGYPASERIPVAELTTAVEEAMRRDALASFEYCPIEGDESLREQLAELGRAGAGWTDEADSIVVTTGARHALTLVARATLRPRATRWPVSRRRSWASSRRCGPRAPRSCRCRSTSTDSTSMCSSSCCATTTSGCWRRSPVSRTRPAPTLPRGAARPSAGANSRQHGFFILEDAVYADLRFEGPTGPLRAHAPEHVIYVDSLSKTVGPGLRAGWVAASGPVLDSIVAEKRRDDGHGGTFSPARRRALPGGEGYHAHLEVARARYRNGPRRDARLPRAQEVGSARADSNAPGRRRPRVGDAAPTTRQDRSSTARRSAAGVSYVPGPAVLVEPATATHLRLSFTALTPEQLRTGVRRLARTIRAQPQATRHRHTLPMA